MILDIFQSEITAIDAELLQLQALLESKRQQQSFLQELEFETSATVGAVALLKERIGAVNTGAIASLKNAVLNLFDDGGNDDGGKQPASTDPTPNTGPVADDDDEDNFELLCLNGETGEALTTDDLDEDETDADGVPCAICGVDLNDEANYPEYTTAALAGICRGCEAEAIEAERAAAAQPTQAEDDVDSEIINPGTKMTYTQVIKNRCSACWGYEVATKDDIKAGFINRTDLSFMGAVNLERKGKEFYQTVEAYLDRLYYNGQSSQLEECPESSRTGQHYQLTSLLWEDAPLLAQSCPVTFQSSPAPFVELVKVSDAIAYQRKYDGEILCCYVGFEKKPVAKSWMKFLEPMAADRIELRQGQRLEAFKWELKIKGMSIGQIERLSKESLDKPHRTEIDSAKPPSYKPRSTPQPVNPDEVEEGDIVTTLYTPGGSYKVLKVMPDGVLDCESLTTGTRFGLLAINVSLVEKAEQSQPLVEKPQLRVKILSKESEYTGQTLPVSRVSPNEMGYTVVLPNVQNQWFRADLVQVLDAEIEQRALPSEPEVIEFDDFVEVVADANDTVGLVGSVGRVVVLGDRIGVEIDEQLVYFNRTELRKAKAEAVCPAAHAPQLILATCGADDALDF